MGHWIVTPVFVCSGLLLCGSAKPFGEQCFDPNEACDEPCPCVVEACYEDRDCTPGRICIFVRHECVPSSCFCFEESGQWFPSLDCAGRCIDIPAISGPPTYTIVSLGTLGGGNGQAASINNLGQVAGQADTAEGRRRAFLWEDGTMQNLGLCGGTELAYSVAADINNLGQVIVNGSNSSCLWENGQMRFLPALNPGRAADAKAINDAGQIVGSSPHSASGEVHWVLWQNMSLIDLTVDFGLCASDVNNFGHLGGSSDDVAAIWADGIITLLGTLDGVRSGASHINDVGQAVGVYHVESAGHLFFYPFYWDRGTMIDLDQVVGPGRVRLFDLTLNNCGQVVTHGDYATDTPLWLYTPDGVFKPVRGVSAPYSRWSYFLPNGINDRGQIVGMGWLEPAGRLLPFLMSPVLGDSDTDGDFDLKDFARLQTAFTGERPPGIPGCERADVDADADVDLGDFLLFEAALTGPE